MNVFSSVNSEIFVSRLILGTCNISYSTNVILSYYTFNKISFTVFTYLNDGNLTIQNVSGGIIPLSTLMVAGGGGGGAAPGGDGGGGGGGGGVGMGLLNFSKDDVLTITIGQGGPNNQVSPGLNGGNTTITDISNNINEVAYGGGYGGLGGQIGGVPPGTGTPGNIGGSGGGGNGRYGSRPQGGASNGGGIGKLKYYGNAGADGTYAGGGGGGGGAGAIGSSTPDGGTGGNGGNGITPNINGIPNQDNSGNSIYYGGGGAGGALNGGIGGGGLGGGGAGAGANSINAIAGRTNTGGGGGGAGGLGQGGSAIGGSGVVVLAIPSQCILNNYNSIPVDPSLVLYYPFDNSLNYYGYTTPNFATGLNLYDATLYGNATITTQSYITGYGDLSLNNTMGSGATDYVTSNNNFALVPSQGLSISCWFSCSGQLNTDGTIISLPIDLSGSELTIDISGTNSIYSSYIINMGFNGLNNTILNTSTYGTINYISINDYGRMVMATSKGIFYSGDYGLSFYLSDANTSYNWVGISIINNGNALACTSSAVYFSANNGKNWTITGAPTSGYNYIRIRLSSSGYAIVITSNASFNSSGKFSTWNGPVAISGFDIGLASNGVGIVGGNQTFQITTNNGASFTYKPGDGNGIIPWVHGASISDNGSYMVVNSNPGSIYYSTNSGTNWTTSNTFIPNLAELMIVGNNGILFNTSNDTGFIYQTNLATDKISYSTGYRRKAFAIAPTGNIVAILTTTNDLVVKYT